MHDARVFSNSSLDSSFSSGKLPPCKRIILPDVDPVPVFILGDTASSLMPYVMKDYSDGESAVQEQ